jgi:multiple sugar transport system substrate-binding protein
MADQQTLIDFARSRRAFLRRMAGLGVSASVAAVLSACGGAPEGPPPSGAVTPASGGAGDTGTTAPTASAGAVAPTSAPAAVAGGATEIVWYMNIDATRNAWAEKAIIPAFEQEHSDIKVTLMTVPWDDFDSKLVSLAAAGTPPDVFSQWGQSGGGTYFHKNLLLPIDELAAQDKWDLSHIPENLRKAYSFDGKLYGVPMYSLGGFIFYNKKLFDEAGVPHPPIDWNDKNWTWDEMVSRAQKLSKDTDNPEKAQFGFLDAMNDLYVGVPWLFGAQVFSDEDYQAGQVKKVNFTAPEMIAAVQAKADLINKLKVSPNQATVKTLSANGAPMGTGRIAMMYGGGWEIWSLKDLKDLDWGIAAVPGQKTNQIPTFSDPWYVSKGSKNPEAAFQLVKYLTTGPGQRSIAINLAAPPADQTLLPEWFKNFPNVKPEDMETVYKGAIAHARETPSSLLYGYGPVEDTYNQVLAPVWNGDKSAAEVLPEAEKQANDALKNL